jgi:histidine triad (HIT) family protein
VADDCIFCRIIDRAAPAFVVAEDDKTMAFLDISGTDGHTLVVPRRHAADIWSLAEEDAEAVMKMAKRVAHLLDDRLRPDGMSLTQANREAAGQEVLHFHLHVIPRWGEYGNWEQRGARPTPAQLGTVLERLR